MKELIDTCVDHDYIFLKSESVPLSEPTLRIVTKEIYACVRCGTGLDFYNLDEPISIQTNEGES